MRKDFFVFIILLLIFGSCDLINPEFNEDDNKIVINSLLNTDQTVGFTISRSTDIKDTNFLSSLLLEDISARIKVNGGDFIQMKNIYKKHPKFKGLFFTYNYVNELVRPNSGDSIEILVETPAYETIHAYTLIPDLIPIESFDTMRIIYPPNLVPCMSRVGFKCNITFTDPLDKNNYYLILVEYFMDTVNTNEILGIDCTDPIVEEFIKSGTYLAGVTFSDKNIQGQKYTFSLNFRRSNLGPPYNYYGCDDNISVSDSMKVVYFKLYNITEDYYKYIQTLNRFYENYKNPLAEQTEVYSNIEGGFGILGGAAVSCDSLVFTY